jgi:hypothetical protein
MNEAPNQALQRTAPRVTLAASSLRLSAYRAASAPRSAVAELGVVRRCYALSTEHDQHKRKKQYMSLWNTLLGGSSKPPKQPPKKTHGSRQGPHCFLCTHWSGAGCSLNLYPKQCDGTMTGNFFEEDE